MKPIRIICLFGFLVLSLMAFSQKNVNKLYKTEIRKNNVDITLGGTGIFISANYNRIVLYKSDYFINASVGIGTVPFAGGTTIPHQLSVNLGKQSSFIELGVGGTYWSGTSNSTGENETLSSYLLYPLIGWRKHFKSNLNFRIYANPLIHISGEHFIEDYTIVPYLGISFGYRF
jgi:hypothetical protein